ncbi:hypothetical protein AB0H73_06345 [Streptomyces olivoreticuli]
MLLSPPEMKIHPRYTSITLKGRDGAPVRRAIRDDERGTFERSFPLATPDRLIQAEIRKLEKSRRRAAVIYYAQRSNRKGTNPWELAHAVGDIVHLDYRERVLRDNGRNYVVIPAERHVRTVWGTTMSIWSSDVRQADGDALTTDRVDVEGWTAPRHRELYYLVHNGSVSPWFAAFALRYGLADPHWQFEECLQMRNEWLPLNANGSAHWLLRCWDREHPETA